MSESVDSVTKVAVVLFPSLTWRCVPVSDR